MFIPRLISGIVMLIIAFFGIYFGGWLLWAIVFALSVIGVFEMYRCLGMNEKKICIAGFAAVIAYYIIIMPIVPEHKRTLLALAFVVLSFLMIMGVYVFSFPKYKANEAFAVIIGALYPGILLSFLYLIRTMDGGVLLTWLVFIAAWGSDTFAYCTGMLCKKFIGTHQMTPKLSPKKSIEGGVGGLLLATVLGVIYGTVFKNNISIFDISVPVACGIIAFVGGMIAMIGDLAASAIKRDNSIKDYGKLIPGHGGVMDRFDSIIFTAPCVYFLIMVLQMF